MELRQLNTFLVICKFQSFTQAADELGYAQSSVTTQIKLLEEELGVKLFERISRSITLTHEGKRLMPYAKQMIKLAGEIKNVITNDEEPSGVLTIGAAESLCVLRLPEIIRVFRELYPKVEVSIKFGNCTDLRHFLRDNFVDVAFSLGSRIDGDDFVTEIALREQMLLLTAPGHRLIGKQAVALSDIEKEPLILTELGCSYRAVFENILSKNNIKPNLILETGSVQAIKQFTMSGLGMTLLPRVAVEEELQGGKLVALNWSDTDFGIVSQVIYHKDKWMSPAIRAFLSLSRSILEKLDQGA